MPSFLSGFRKLIAPKTSAVKISATPRASEIHFTALIAEAEQLASDGDFAAAIAGLEAARDHADFFPWPAFTLVRLYQRAEERVTVPDAEAHDRAIDLTFELARRHPDIQAIWSPLVVLTRYSPEYKPAVDQVFAEMARVDRFEANWLEPTIIECAVNQAPDLIVPVLDTAQQVGMLNDSLVEGVIACARFSHNVRCELATLATPVKSWSFCFGRDTAIVAEPGAHVRVNLSRLGLTGLPDWIPDLSHAFVMALRAALDWSTYVDDEFLSSWPGLSASDNYNALYAQFLRPILIRRPDMSRHAVSAECARVEPGDLWVRGGNVELSMLSNFLLDEAATLEAAETVALSLQTAQEVELTALTMDDPWWPRLSLAANITRMATNAGWYAKPGLAGSSLKDWATRYHRALVRGKILQTHCMDFMKIVPYSPQMREKPTYGLSDHDILAALSGQKVVFATSFAEQAASQFDSGRLQAIWRQAGHSGDMISLCTVPAPMSIWPYAPKDSWTQSFNALCDACDTAIRDTGATVFVAACGGYGLPLVEEMNRRFGLTCIYNGHIMNMYFGVMTNTFKGISFYEKTAGPAWIGGALNARYAHIGRVDDGRYGS